MNSKRRSPKGRKRGKQDEPKALWFVLRDGDGDVCAVSQDRRALEDTKDHLEKTRPCGTYRIDRRRTEDPQP